MAKQIIIGQDARDVIKRTTDKVVDVIASTLGPRGQNVALQRQNLWAEITNDGATISKNISLRDQFENTVVSILNEASQQTNKVGDGTTSTLVIARSIISKGLKLIAAGANPMALKRGINKAVDILVDEINNRAIQVESDEQIKKVATIAANNDPDLGGLIAEAFEKIGKEGVVTIEDSKTAQSKVEIVKGMQFKNGYISPYLAAHAQDETIEFENPFILLYEKSISSLKPIVPVLDTVIQAQRPLLIIAENFEGEALTSLIMNVLQNGFKLCAVKAPFYGDKRRETLHDLAAITGATFISEDVGIPLDRVTIDHLGQAGKVVIKKDTTTISEGKGSQEAKDARIAKLRSELEALEEGKDDTTRENLKERLAKLVSGIAVVKLGASTEPEMKEKRYRGDDALLATKAAIEKGVVVGGGTTLLAVSSKITEALETFDGDADEAQGMTLVKDACGSIVSQIAENAGMDGTTVLNKVLEGDENYGFNAATLEYVNMYEAGIIEPALVLTSALKNGASVAGMLLTTSSIVAELPEKTKTITPGVLI